MESVGRRKRHVQALKVNFSDKGPKKSSGEYSKEYRKRVKASPELYKLHRRSENLRIQNYRHNEQSEEAKQRNRDLQKLRQNKYRAKLKAEGRVTKPPKTRKAQEHQRVKWREQKKQQRANISHQKRSAINAKRRKHYSESSATPTAKARVEVLANSFRTAKSRQKKMLFECVNHMPNDPNLKAAVIEATINEQSPRTKQSIHERLGMASPNHKVKRKLALDVSESLKETMLSIKSRRNIKDMRLRRLVANALKIKGKAVLKSVGLSKKLYKRVQNNSNKPGWEDTRKKRKDALSEESCTAIVQFYDTVSKDIPNIRGAVKVDGQFQGRKILDASMKSAYDRYAKEEPNPVSYSTFVKQKPTSILPFTDHRFRECLCEYCLNVDLILKAVNSFCSSSGKDCHITDRYAASRLTLCPKVDGIYRKACLDRKCTNCGTSKISAHLLPILDEQHIHTPVTWWQWEMGENRRLTKVKKESVTEGLVETLESKIDMLSKHLFNAKWQYDQYKSLARNPPDDTAVLCMDYAENFTCKAQDAPQGFHWNNIQCTIHSIVASYRCKTCEDIPVKTVTDSLVFVSDDLNHDYHAVQHFVGLAIQLLKEDTRATLTRVIQFSDGAPTQYKNKVNFTNCSFSENDFGVKSEKHFFGSRHGKGPCDREIGVLKKCAKAAVAAGGEVILSPKEFFTYCKNNLTLPKEGSSQHAHTRRRFLFVSKTEINRNNQQRTNVKPLKDTRKYHSIRAIQPYVVSARERSCFCVSCFGDSPDLCINSDITGSWVVANLQLNRGGRQNSRGNTNDAPGGVQPIDASDGVQSTDASDGVQPIDASDGVQPIDAPGSVQPIDASDGVQPIDVPGGVQPIAASVDVQHALTLDMQLPDLGIDADMLVVECPLPIGASDGVQPINASDGVQPIDASDGAQPIDPQVGVQPIDASDGAQPIDAQVGVQPIVAPGGVQPIDASVDVQHALTLDMQLPDLDIDSIANVSFLEMLFNDSSFETGDISQLIVSLEESTVASEDDVQETSVVATSTEHTIPRVGEYIAIKFGKSILPAVVTDWPFVRYFKKECKRSFWSEMDILHTVVLADMKCILEVPSIKMIGSRIYYIFDMP